ncbi:MAG: family 20 glycosylhydrolase [Kiritimatiellia bacterium]
MVRTIGDAEIMDLFSKEQPIITRRGFHLDLKGVPPTAERLLRLLDIFAAARYNVVLLEWEDMFPWTVDERFRCETAYSPEVIRSFAEKAAQLGVEIIPLVQCLGHMETPLSVPGYERLREVPDRPDVLNPLAPGSRELVESMVYDVLRLLPEVKHFHLGGDEAWTFGSHPDTQRFIAQHGRSALYLKHVEPILDGLNARGIRPMLWHDMMRDWDADALLRLAPKADLVVWGYRGHPDTTQHHFNRKVIERFVEHGLTLWAATAYKGADGPDADLPSVVARQENALAWVEVARRYHFAGILATAWSRYSTQVMQNEPIDAALDSAVNVGVILHDGSPAPGGITACQTFLQQLGEKEKWEKCRLAMVRLSNMRQKAWDLVRWLRELTYTVRYDVRRRPSFWLQSWLQEYRKILDETARVREEVRVAFAGFVPSVWIERYLAERLDPLADELRELEHACLDVSKYAVEQRSPCLTSPQPGVPPPRT